MKKETAAEAAASNCLSFSGYTNFPIEKYYWKYMVFACDFLSLLKQIINREFALKNVRSSSPNFFEKSILFFEEGNKKWRSNNLVCMKGHRVTNLSGRCCLTANFKGIFNQPAWPCWVTWQLLFFWHFGLFFQIPRIISVTFWSAVNLHLIRKRD